MMKKDTRMLSWHLALGAAITLVGLGGVDAALSQWLERTLSSTPALLDAGTRLLDLASGKTVSKFLLGAMLAGAALLLLPWPRLRGAGTRLLAIALVQAAATLATGMAKTRFGRLRPFEMLEGADPARSWFAGGSSFPSGHAGFYFGLFLPLAVAFPRGRWVLLLPPWFIAVARITANEHFASDVGASILVAATLALAASRWLAPPGVPRPG